ncbi:hypothetical protein [Streptomyces himalayensis]|uniref:Uncharacterized protein n=2 Tax=Streptomyces himalayensis TaxID=2820085 RepID=A0A7W2HJ77_9ACTN|nr:hypothetical protein [Streptomyces himalayensis]MBA2947325.1 hypothetical protein [Streptomyces himalayensis subsp. himalayensis]MBA4865559.1 hypothetical protein [Streptomyces himalayensis subsp. aureolus]
MNVAPVRGGTAVQDHVALAEIELCGELIIAASASREERLSSDLIDEVLRVAERDADFGAAEYFC